MGHKFEFNAPKHARLMRYFTGVCVRDLWFVEDLNKWVTIEEARETQKCFSSHHNVYDGAPKTFRAFSRYFKRHPELNGRTVTFCNKFYNPVEKYNYDIIARPIENLTKELDDEKDSGLVQKSS